MADLIVLNLLKTLCGVRGYLSILALLVLCLSFALPLWAISSNIHIQTEPPFFSPNSLAVTSGTSLIWKNYTHEAHSIVSDDCGRLSGCSFDSGIIRPEERFSLPFLQPGRYPYHCGLHPFMRGLRTVTPATSPSTDI